MHDSWVLISVCQFTQISTASQAQKDRKGFRYHAAERREEKKNWCASEEDGSEQL